MQEFEIVLEAAFDQLVDWDDLDVVGSDDDISQDVKRKNSLLTCEIVVYHILKPGFLLQDLVQTPFVQSSYN